MLTGGLAALAGYLTVRSTYLANDAIYHSTRGVLCQAQSSDAWAEYQAESIKARIAETALETATDPAVRQQLTQEAADFRDKQTAPEQQAKDLANQRDIEMALGTHRLGERDTLNYAGMATQLGIALASVAALTKRYNVFVIGIFCGLGGLALTAFGLFQHFFVHP
jgi:hypothetical protein